MGTQTLPNRCEFPTLRACSQKVFVNASSAARNVPGGGACNRGIQKRDPCPHLRCSFFARVTIQVYLRRSAFPTAFSTCHARRWTRAYCLRLTRQPAKVSVRVRGLRAGFRGLRASRAFVQVRARQLRARPEPLRARPEPHRARPELPRARPEPPRARPEPPRAFEMALEDTVRRCCQEGCAATQTPV